MKLIGERVVTLTDQLVVYVIQALCTNVLNSKQLEPLLCDPTKISKLSSGFCGTGRITGHH